MGATQKLPSTNEYDKWFMVLSLLYVVLLIWLVSYASAKAIQLQNLFGLFELTIITLATWRLTRLFVYDKIFASIRGFFVGKRGLRGSIGEIMNCPWCISIWLAYFVVLGYLLVPSLLLVYIILSISALASILQILSNFIGWSAERQKQVCNKK